MTHPFNIWLSNLLSIHTGIVIMLETLLCIGLFLCIPSIIVWLVGFVEENYNKSDGAGKFFWWIFLVGLAIFVFILHWIIAVIAFGCFLVLLNSARDWFHKGAGK